MSAAVLLEVSMEMSKVPCVEVSQVSAGGRGEMYVMYGLDDAVGLGGRLKSALFKSAWISAEWRLAYLDRSNKNLDHGSRCADVQLCMKSVTNRLRQLYV